MKLKGMNRLLDIVISLVSKVSMYAILIAGLMILLVSVGIALYTPTKLFAVLVAAVGCSIGSVIIAMSMPKLASARFAEDQRQIELVNLSAEVERQKRMKIDVNSYRAILKLGVAELDSEVTDFKKLILSNDEKEWYEPGRDELVEYVGVLHYKFKAFLGVDLTKLRFRDDPKTGALEVSGLKSEYQGMKDQHKNWLLREIRSHKTKSSILWEDYQILDKDGRLVDMSDAQENELTSRINNGLNFKSLDAHIIKMSAEFIRLLLVPLGRSITFETTQNIEGVGFVEYLEFHNIDIDKKIMQLEEKKTTYLLTEPN